MVMIGETFWIGLCLNTSPFQYNISAIMVWSGQNSFLMMLQTQCSKNCHFIQIFSEKPKGTDIPPVVHLLFTCSSCDIPLFFLSSSSCLCIVKVPTYSIGKKGIVVVVVGEGVKPIWGHASTSSPSCHLVVVYPWHTPLLVWGPTDYWDWGCCCCCSEAAEPRMNDQRRGTYSSEKWKLLVTRQSSSSYYYILSL